MAKIGLSAGHGLYTPGKRTMRTLDHKQTREWWLNQRILVKVLEILKGYNVTVFRYDDPSGKRDIPLKERTTNANNDKLDFYLSIHHNGGANGSAASGTVMYKYPKSSTETNRLQPLLYKSIVKNTGLVGNRSTPLKSANFHEVRETRMPSLLLENGFMDSTVDVPIILSESHATKTAKGIADFLIKEFKLSKKEPKDYFIKGDKGQGVLQVQENLYELGYKLLVDGLYGDGMTSVVSQFQKDNSLEIDGVAGPNTQAKINEKIKEKKNEKKDYILPDGQYFRVITGSYNSRNNAQEMQDKLKGLGIDSFLSVYKK